MTQVTDREMSDGMTVVGLNGFDCEMASGSVPAGIRKLRKEGTIKKDDVVVGILTGRQKDPTYPFSITAMLQTYARPPRTE